MAKYTLESNFDFGFILFGIKCHESEYRICSAINRSLNIDLVRDKSLELKNKKQQDILNFSVFSFIDENSDNTFYLVNNLSSNAAKVLTPAKNPSQGSLFDEVEQQAANQKGRLIPEKEDVDFFFMLSGDFTSRETDEWKDKLEKTEVIINLKEIDPESLPSKNNLLF